ncbi:hypothetical protein GCM10010435_44910 [Winogradskya consettensis]|uniref:Putative Flp pilus-assembly TadG-like N-terminal domain-containing protein n=1 Tax=Winogradskya consettensis TaxID=113560 RepID=A0A919VWL4_9ACTN|nr:Rv3654c family TadE-like protein [Actinoplanes consettensis]GIM82794.1 hypothetical protein Aco04nite_83300 [Actinoplanes consettensis]
MTDALVLVEKPGRRLGFDDDRGAATVFVLAVGLALLMAGSAGATVGAVRVARHQARAAADLGALAGAMRAAEGPAPACTRAAEIVTANNAALTACHTDGFTILVTAEVEVSPLPGMTLPATANARAGPIYGS